MGFGLHFPEALTNETQTNPGAVPMTYRGSAGIWTKNEMASIETPEAFGLCAPYWVGITL